jgi:hypothetical protein
MNILEKILNTPNESAVQPKVIVGELLPKGDDFPKKVTIDGVPLKSCEDPDYPAFNWGYSGTGPTLLANSLVVELFKVSEDDQLEDGTYVLWWLGEVISDVLLHSNFDGDSGFEITDPAIIEAISPKLEAKIKSLES